MTKSTTTTRLSQTRLSRRAALGLLAATPLALALTTRSAEAKSAWNASFFGNVAIEGADPVAYHVLKKRVDGSADITATYEGAVWRFASTAHRDLFLANPAKYAPAYGGYCAWAVAQGYTASIDPDAWKVVDGKLYLNYSKGVQANWEQDIPGFIKAGDKNWPGIKAGLN